MCNEGAKLSSLEISLSNRGGGGWAGVGGGGGWAGVGGGAKFGWKIISRFRKF